MRVWWAVMGDLPRPTTANQRRTTTRRQIAIADDRWKRLHDLVGDQRAEVVRQLIDFYLREPGAKMPRRPPRH